MFALAAVGSALFVAGCGGGDSSAESTTPANPAPAAGSAIPAGGPDAAGAGAVAVGAPSLANLPADMRGFKLTAEAGVPIEGSTTPDMKELLALAGQLKTQPRSDPFALLAVEKKYETSQTAERLMADFGGFSDLLADTTEKVDENDGVPISEPAPPGLRLAGVILANGVAALLEFNGRLLEIRPGMTIPGTEWVVVSIDNEKAVLRRPGNKLPKEIVVPLASRSEIGGAAAGGGTQNGGGSGQAGEDGGGGGGRAGRGRAPLD